MELKERQEKIQQKRKNTNFRNYIKEIASWFSTVFYRNNGLISIYPKNNKFAGVISAKKYETYIEELTNSGINYDFKINFFENFDKLYKTMYFPNVRKKGNSENVDFADITVNSSNAYLSYVVTYGSENVMYSLAVRENSRNIINSVMVFDNSENIYMSNGIVGGFNIYYSKFINNSSDIWFSTNLNGCHNCMFCNDLENKSYYINNKKYSKKEYQKLKTENFKKKDKYLNWFLGLDNKGKNLASTNVKGNFVLQSEDVENSHYSNNIKNGRNLMFVGGKNGDEDMYDVFIGGAKQANDFYGVAGSGSSQYIYCSANSSSNNIYYGINCLNCSHCLGCIGLKNKSFCVLNKQYSKDERFKLADKIFEQMDKDGILGDFFPADMNPFYFNDTAAYLIDDSFTKEEVEKEGYLRRDEKIKVDIPEGLETVSSSELDKYQGFDSDGNRTISPDILKKVIIDAKGNSYRIIKMEYDFLIKHGLPLPEIHWLDRIKLGFKFK